MCGITGYRLIDLRCERIDAELDAAVAALRHRGPDDVGTWKSDAGGVGLGFRRLSILDLTKAGHQPMASSCGEWMMVFNGEVYNYGEIRADLERKGRHFRGTGDSETILEAFSEWGIDVVERFVGMFAIALWHHPTRRLHLIRDRLGVKPLYYHWDGKALYFGSELKALRAFHGWEPQIDLAALADYLQYGYIADPLSIYRDVFKLPAGHHATLEPDGRLDLSRYWNLEQRMQDLERRTEASLADELDALMSDAFVHRLISDVPVGVFLSGGIDSTVVSAVLQRHAGQDIKTFTIGFDRPEFDESQRAEAVASHLGTDHHTRHLRVDDAKDLLRRWCDLYDEPFGDESGLATLMVSEAAAEHVKVVLSADGGDELFSGYSSYTTVIERAERLARVPSVVKSVLDSSLDVGIGTFEALPSQVRERAARVSPSLSARAQRLVRIGRSLSAGAPGELYENAISVMSSAEVKSLVGRDPAIRRRADEYAGLPGEQFCLWDLHYYLPGDILTKVDRATMAASIEGREPLLDHRLVEFAFSLPFSLRRGELGPKHLMKYVLTRYIPDDLVRRPKQGFAVPVTEWITADLRDLVSEHLSASALSAHGLLDPPTVRRWLGRMDRGDREARRRIWVLLAFQMWYSRWMTP